MKYINDIALKINVKNKTGSYFLDQIYTDLKMYHANRTCVNIPDSGKSLTLSCRRREEIPNADFNPIHV